LQVKVTDANGNVLAGQTVSMMAGNGATVAPTVITEPDGTVEIPVTSQTARWRSLSPARRQAPVRSLPALTAAARAGM
ncbi:hypothetical protein AZE46_005442, partial [Escherichia coli]|nr:hypothetical protein [Escherichia coli]